MYLRLLVLTF